MCTRVGVLDRGRLVLQDRLDILLRPTGLVEVRTPDAAAAASLLGAAVVWSRTTGCWSDPTTRPV